MNPRAKVEEIALYLGKPWKFSRLGEASNWSFDIVDGSGRGLYFGYVIVNCGIFK